MKGKHQIVVQNKRIHFSFSVKRNITLIKGDSATGKTTLFSMIEEYDRLGNDSGIQVQCDKRCTSLSGQYWEDALDRIKDAIVFIDEDSKFVKSNHFAEKIQNSDNYYVIITRENLPSLPYSVEEIYGIHSSGKYKNTRQVYNLLYKLYPDFLATRSDVVQNLLIEDSQSGFQFFSKLAEKYRVDCESAYGKSNIAKKMQEYLKSKRNGMLVVADGAAFGPEMDRVSKLINRENRIKIYLPESFEWLLLESDILNDGTIRKILDSPAEFIESEKYFSWEKYFTELLIEKTQKSPYAYEKTKLPSFYLQDKNLKKIVDKMQTVGIQFVNPAST